MVEINSNTAEGIHTIAINGEIDASSSIELDNAINQATSNNETRILIDCTAMEYISSAGLGVFMSNIKEFEEKEIKMVLFGLSEKVLNVFSILGLDQLLKITVNKEDALSIV